MLTVLPESFSWQNAQSILNEAYQKCIIIRPIFVELMGSLQSGAYLSFCYFWAGKGTNTEWTYQTEKGFTESIYLSQYQQRKARAELGKKGWWEEKMMKVGNTPKLHFKIDKKKLDEEVILLILNKAETQSPSDALETHYSESVTVTDSRTERSIQRLPITKLDQDAHTENFSKFQTTDHAWGDSEIEQFDTETPIPGSLAGANLPLGQKFDPDSLEEAKRAGGGCSIKPDSKSDIFGNERLTERRTRQAQQASWLNLGIKNGRWKDLQDYRSFERYASEWARSHPELVLRGKKVLDNPKGYLIALLTRTAQCVDDSSKDLAIWKNWQLEKQAFSPEFVAPAHVVVTTTIKESRARFKKLLDASKLEIAKNQAAREAEQRASQEKRWGLMGA